MNLLLNIIINIYSICILTVILNNTKTVCKNKNFIDKIFIFIVKITMLLLVLDVMSRFDGERNELYPFIDSTGNFLMFCLNLTLPSLWIMYAHGQIFLDKRRTKRLIIPLGIVNALNVVMVLINHYTGWYYTISSDNIYMRGNHFYIPQSIALLMIVIPFVMPLIYRRRISKKHFISLIEVAIIPFISVVLSLFIYGISFMIGSMSISVLIVYLNIQTDNLYIDYLTKLNNRERLDIYLSGKIKDAAKGVPFSAAMLDIDNFKMINDTYGHTTGDKALSSFAEVMNKEFGEKHFLARYAGDEFCMIMDSSDTRSLIKMENRLRKKVNEFNALNKYPFRISFSMGYTAYEPYSNLSMDEYINKIDELMYKDKNARKMNKH